MSLLLIVIAVGVAVSRSSWSSHGMVLLALVLAVPGVVVDLLILFGRDRKADEHGEGRR
jgi:hypothetical protein